MQVKNRKQDVNVATRKCRCVCVWVCVWVCLYWGVCKGVCLAITLWQDYACCLLKDRIKRQKHFLSHSHTHSLSLFRSLSHTHMHSLYTVENDITATFCAPASMANWKDICRHICPTWQTLHDSKVMFSSLGAVPPTQTFSPSFFLMPCTWGNF